jgi:prepilin-type N-terminal cleavage/methylation domain-containing protein
MRAFFTRRLRQESGFTLIEVVVSAALLAVVSAGVYAGIDGPTQVSGQARVRAGAANMAQFEQEKMRAMRFSDLQNYQYGPVSRPLNGVNYTVTSKTDWIEDSNDSTGCSAPTSTQGDYLRLTSTVAWPGGGRNNPVVITSLMAPPVNDAANGTGNLVVKLVDQANKPVAGIPVVLSGRASYTRSTDASGCAVFVSIPSGNYNATLNTANYVDNNNQTLVTMQTSVTAGNTAQLQHAYAKAVGINFKFVDSAGATLSPTWTRGSVSGGVLSAPKAYNGSPPNTGLTLFPTTAGNYTAWAGGCADPGTGKDFVVTPMPAPGSSATATLTVPLLTFKVSTNGLPAAPRIVIKPQDSTCTDTYPNPTSSTQGTAPNAQYIWPARLPYGKYSVCADLNYGGQLWRTTTPFPLNNLQSAGTTVQLALTTDSFGNPTGATATPTDGSGMKSSTLTSGSACP